MIYKWKRTKRFRQQKQKREWKERGNCNIDKKGICSVEWCVWWKYTDNSEEAKMNLTASLFATKNTLLLLKTEKEVTQIS